MKGPAEIAHGPMYIGFLFNVLLHGIMITQIYLYYSHFKKDQPWMKIFVAGLFIADSLNTVFDAVYLYDSLVKHFDDVSYLGRATWVFATDPALTGIIAGLVQLFFAWRVKVLSNNLWLVGLVVVCSLAGTVGGIITSFEVGITPEFVNFLVRHSLARGGVLWRLDHHHNVGLEFRAHKTGFQASDELIDRIIRLTMQTGLLTALVACLDLLFFLTDPTGTQVSLPAPTTLPSIPTNFSIPQFFLDFQDGAQLVGASKERQDRAKASKQPWLIEDGTGRRIYVDELKSRTSGLSNALRVKYNIGLDDVVLIFSRNHVDYPVAIWAVHRLGGIVSSANPDFASNELEYQLRSSGASLMLVHPDALETALSAAKSAGLPRNRVIVLDLPRVKKSHSLPTVKELVIFGTNQKLAYVEPQIDARTKLAFLSYSSGTTGKPKAVAIPHYSLITNVIQFAVHHKVYVDYTSWDDQRYRDGDVMIGVLPFYHIYGLVLNLHFVLFARMTLVVVPKFNFVQMLESIQKYKIGNLMLVPPQIVLLCKHPAVKNYDLKGIIRSIMVGAAPLSNEVNQQLFSLLPEAHIGQGYGMTETCTASSCWSIESKRGPPGCSGQLMPGVLARILKPDGTYAGYDEPGEVLIYSPSNALGYHNNEQAWVKTGDEARLDKNNNLWILDRIKEIMKVRGFQVAPAELEGCILDHPDVSDTTRVGGEVPMAFVVLSADAAKRVETDRIAGNKIKESIKKHVAVNKIAYKQLAGGVEFVPLIPKNPSGKLLRRVLREKANEMRKVKAKL
ncbi:hypothetical protein D9758_012036 [Tetrapyrgos nigripes]|uniref:Acetyl-CoA synthetase-like protein n=1 Tax=Tetrapyrgos nigripes TaxID=182062 RepID=A0A8H5CPE4_9AGAR|nr:hypothetical protein D9758_012036 [Tetrapyrgos nigripes]